MSYQQEQFKAIADKIREKTGSTNPIKPIDFVNKIDEVYEAGIASVPPSTEDRYDEGYADGKENTLHNFFHSLQDGGKRTNYYYAFAYMNSRDFYPIYNISPTSNQANHIFRYFNNVTGVENEDKNFDLAQRLQELGIVLDFSQCTGTAQLCFGYARIFRIPECDFSNCTVVDRVFYSITNLERIDKVIGGPNTSFYSTYGTAFYKLSNLKYIRFGGTIGGASNIDLSGSPLLEVECFTNENGDGLFDCLADKSSDTAQTWTCTIGATNLEKLTDAQKAIATEKGWTLA